MADLKVALVHDWLTNFAGAERVLVALHKAYPEAPIFTTVYNQVEVPQFADADIRTSFLQRIPLARRRHQLFPSLRTMAVEGFDFEGFDVVISSSSAEAKGIIVPPTTMHVSFIHTPTRYYWSGYHEYLENPGFGRLDPVIRTVMPRMVHRMRQWDYLAAQRPDHLISNSHYVNARIAKYYRRTADVIHPPVSTERFTAGRPKDDFYLVVSRLVPYKRVDLAIAACRELDLPLVVIGQGPERARLEADAGPRTRFLGRLSDEETSGYYERARGFIFTSEEDFGITPLEASAAGTAVIAFGKGGALETVVEGTTGLFFAEQTTESVVKAIAAFENQVFDPAACRAHAESFSEENFIQQMTDYVRQRYQVFVEKTPDDPLSER